MKRQRVDHAALIDELHAQLTVRIGEMATSDDWLAYLETARKFHRYSPQNQMLLALQGASGYVASYRNWTCIPSTDGGTCQVAKGQKGLTILAPMVAKVVDVDEATGEESSRKRLRGFRTVKVFHEGQLVAPPAIPEPHMPELLTGENRWQHVWSAVVGQLESEGFDVQLHERLPIEKWNGLTNYVDRTVQVAGDLEPPQRIKTLLHEWAHVHLDHEHRTEITRDVKEVEAESVAYLLSQSIGLDSQRYTVPYVAGWARGDLDVVESAAQAVLTTTKRLVETLEMDLGIELTPDALDHAIDPDIVELDPPTTANERSESTTTPKVEHDGEQLTIEGVPKPKPMPKQGLDSLDLTDAEFVLAVKNHLEPEPGRRLMEIAFEPNSAPEAAILLAEAGLSAGQTARVLDHFGRDTNEIRQALLAPMSHDAERPTLWSETEVAAALPDASEPVIDVAAPGDARANATLIAQTYRSAEPDRVAALAYGLGVPCADVIRVCAHSRPDPAASVEIAVAMHHGDVNAAIAELKHAWPNPPGGWDEYLPTAPAVAEVDEYASTQAILDEWNGIEPAADPTISEPSLT
ncbi:MAG: ArdC-like ssDNA-binding domain-containing protein [Ilumatobacter sp.]|uniref:ArdC-like ssDNA-binding domain-containing protein n=1 Tax=Ilumatobacter sp. TaxID=1967498 RepID=UPI003919858B